MYEIDDLVIYSNMGVCRVVAIKSGSQIAIEREGLYYVLEPLYQKCTVCVPVDAKQIFMRPIIAKDEAETLIDLIPSIQAKKFHSSDQRVLEEHYKTRLKKHSCLDLIELTMSIYEKKQTAVKENKKVGAVDSRFMQLAEDQLFGELGAALGIEKDAVPAYIARRISGQKPQKSKLNHKKAKPSAE
jgi:CarD family transcriptional regulator